MEHSDDDDGARDRSRSRSPIPRVGDDIDEEGDFANFSPASLKIAKVVHKIVKAELEPVKKNLNKVLNTSSQIKSVADQTKRGVHDVKKSNAQIEDQLKKAARADPKSSLSPFVIGKLNGAVFRNLKQGKSKEDTLAAVVAELLDEAIISAPDEDAVKKVAAAELKHLKAHLRMIIGEDLALGNYVGMPKATKYMKKHLNDLSVDTSNQEFFTIMAVALVKFENSKSVPLSDADRGNLARITENLDNYWLWVNMKFTKFQQTEESLGRKLKTLMESYGYQQKKIDRSVRRTSV